MAGIGGWALAAKLAWRDLRAAKTRFLFAVMAISIGVAALSGVRGACAAFREMLLKDARMLLAADLSISLSRQPEDGETAVLREIEDRGAAVTPVTELMTMVGGASLSRPLAVNLKAVDPRQYPYYGSVTLSSRQDLREALGEDALLPSQDLLVRLGAELGDTVRVGEADFRIASVVLVEPDRMTGAANFGPRAMLSQAGLARTGLVQFGSRVTSRFLIRLPQSGLDVDEARNLLRAGMPEGRITDYRETNPRIQRGLDRTTSYLSLVSLLAMAIGGIGVAMVIYAHLQQRLDTIAILKCYGATPGSVLRIFTLEAVLLGLLGSTAGVGLGLLLQGLAPSFIAAYFPEAPSFSWQAIPAIESAGVGLATVLMFSLPTLLSTRKVQPALIFRRDMASRFESSPGADRRRLLRKAAAGAVLLGGIGLVATWLGDSLRLGAWFVGGVALSVAGLAATAWGLMAALKAAPSKLPFRIPVGLRHGIANLHRPGMHAGVILVAIGVGVTFTLTVYLLQTTVLAQLLRDAPEGMPNVYLSNITSKESAAVEEFLRSQPGVEGDVILVPRISARLDSGGRVSTQSGRGRGSWRGRRSRDITWSDAPPAGFELLRGAWWEADEEDSVVSVMRDMAEYMGLDLGTRLHWQAGGREFVTTVVSVHDYDGEPDWLYDFVMNREALEGLPATYVGGARVSPAHSLEVSKAAFEAFPGMLFVNAVDFFETVQQVVDQIALVVRFVSAFAILAGVIVLASSVTATRFRRLREAAVLKTLGATRGRLAEIFSIEFLILGAVAGLSGSALAVVYTALMVRDVLDLEAVVPWGPIVVAVLGSALLATAAGWVASLRVLGSRPMEILRYE